jgi:hypothetical protein
MLFRTLLTLWTFAPENFFSGTALCVPVFAAMSVGDEDRGCSAWVLELL